MVVLNRRFPVARFLDSEIISTDAPLPLSQIAPISPLLSISPSGGIRSKSSIFWAPCNNMAGLKLPILSKGAPPPPRITAIVGRTCCGHRGQNLLRGVLGVFGGERELVEAGAHADCVEQGIFRAPGAALGVTLEADGIGVDGHGVVLLFGSDDSVLMILAWSANGSRVGNERIEKVALVFDYFTMRYSTQPRAVTRPSLALATSTSDQ